MSIVTMTVSDVKTLVERLIPSGVLSDNLYFDFINTLQADLVKENTYIYTPKTGTWTSAASAYEDDVSGFQMYEVWDTTNTKQLPVITREEAYKTYGDTWESDTDSYVKALITDGIGMSSYRIYPALSSGKSIGFKIIYQARPTLVTTLSDTLSTDKFYIDIYVQYVIMRFYMLKTDYQDLGMAQMHERQYLSAKRALEVINSRSQSAQKTVNSTYRGWF